MHQDPVESPKRSTKQMSLWELHRISLKKFWQNIRKSRKSSFIHSGKCNWKCGSHWYVEKPLRNTTKQIKKQWKWQFLKQNVNSQEIFEAIGDLMCNRW